MEITYIDRQSMKELLTLVGAGGAEIVFDCGGGDALAAMSFVSAVKANSLEKTFSIHVVRAESAAAYVVLNLDCNRTIQADGTITIHGGHIEGELNVLFLTGIWRSMSNFFRDTITLLKKISTSERLDIFYACNHLTLTREEIERAGIKFI